MVEEKDDQGIQMRGANGEEGDKGQNPLPSGSSINQSSQFKQCLKI
jgi:hypothetical protein